MRRARRRFTGVVIWIGASAILLTASSCSLFTKENAKSALDAVKITCALERAALDDAAIAKACGVADALVPDLRTILTSHRTALSRQR